MVQHDTLDVVELSFCVAARLSSVCLCLSAAGWQESERLSEYLDLASEPLLKQVPHTTYHLPHSNLPL